MDDLEYQIQQEKERYFKYVESNKGKHVFVYGAGRQAIPVVKMFLERGIEIDGYCVSDKELNKDIEGGVPIVQVNEISYRDEEVIFISGVRDSLNSEIEGILKQNGYTNFLPSSDLIKYFGEYGYSFYINPMMEITTQLGCAINCQYCPQALFVKEYTCEEKVERILSYENFVKCIDKLPENVLIEFAGFTEPFFNSECLNMIRYAKSQKHKVNVFTTLMGVDRSLLNELISIDFEEFVLHLPDQEGYSNIPVTEEYLELLKILANAKKTNGENYIGYACSQGTVPENVKEVLGKNTRIYVVLNDRAGNLEDPMLYGQKNLKGKLRCELSHDIDHNVLLPDGRVVICSNDWGMKHVYGNLLTNTYDEIMQGEEAMNIRRAMQDEQDTSILCRNCFQARVCNSRSVED